VGGLSERGVDLPVLIRFGDLLDASIAHLNESFRRAIEESGYTGCYRGVYPIKVNQQEQVVSEIASFGRRYHHGLEAGSKAELAAALAYMHDPEALIVCNGYKDGEFVDLALYALKMGLQTVIVLETPGELSLTLRRAERLGVRPRLGLRVRLSSRSEGRWQESGGDRSVFGLSISQIVDVLDKLRNCDMLDCLQMLHYHLGSQIPEIQAIRTGIAEAARVYVDMVREGAAMGLLNVGGGLAIDYDGSNTTSSSSRNYSVDEYCADLIEVIMAVSDAAGTPHPTIVSESGRALVANSSVLLFNVLDVARMGSCEQLPPLPDDAHELLQNLFEVAQSLKRSRIQECYHDALHYRDQIRALFAHGEMRLRERAMGEKMFWHVIACIADEVRGMKRVPSELRDLESVMADIYYGNFSIFQSLPDSWAIDQLFPVMPIHRLDERPTRYGILADCTCDCDGKIDHFISASGVSRALPLHELGEDRDYVLGVFLVGAYQETLGDLHNLFGDTNVVGVRLSDDGKVEYSHEIVGDSVADVLSYVEYEKKDLINRFRTLAESAVRASRITPLERRAIMEALREGLQGYTYFESEGE